eukprot:comp20936_c0_seq1/m.43713 comp20936_c0_seq1/g.43713  ORF comp20936_c0_seq1/g.43713 comp20936_c0_seq1/m.43713 type:complete len:181 (-) comp20936_c0_seq1:13-555(-)
MEQSTPSVTPAVSKSASAAPNAKDGQSTIKKLQKELAMLMMDGAAAGVSAFPDGDNMFSWIGTIVGGKGTPYEGQEYKLSLKFPGDYPFTSPTVKFETMCFHPNVDAHGNICLDILKEKWSAIYNVKTVLLSIQSLLADPNNDSPLNAFAAQLWENKDEYKRTNDKKYKDAMQASGSSTS